MIIGIVGKANVGKSSFFKAATLAEVKIENRPFVTLEPNTGVAYIKINCTDKEFKTKCNPKKGFCINSKRFTPIKLLDVAGLVPGSHKGKGMGNKFLDDLNQADALIHVIDISGKTNEKGEPTQNYNPENDIKFLEHELDMWYLRILKKSWNKFIKQTQQEKTQIYKAINKQMSGLRVTEEIAKQAIKSLPGDITKWTEQQLKQLATELRKQTKPTIIAANKIDIKDAEKNLKNIQNKYKLIPCSAESEIALRQAAKDNLIEYIPGEDNFKIKNESKLNKKQINALNFIKQILNKYKTTGIQDTLDHITLNILKYIAVFPVANSKLQDKDGNTLPDCLLVPKNTTAINLAYTLHQDIGKNFIRAINLKTKQVIGKNQTLKHRDVIEIIAK